MKRPMVWGVGLLFLCFLIRIIFFNKQVQKEQYCLDAFFDREAFCNAIGTIEQIEQKKNSIFIYLKDVLSSCHLRWIRASVLSVCNYDI